MDPPMEQTCGDYLKSYLDKYGGEVYNPAATSQCQYCSLSNADQFLLGVGISWSARWRNLGIIWGYIVFNVLAALLLYYNFRIRTWKMGFLEGWIRNVRSR